MSLQAWDSLPQIPNQYDYEHFREIAHRLPDLYVLRDVNYQSLVKKIQDCQFVDRFSECLYRMINGNCTDLEHLLCKKMTKLELSVSII